ncbi:SDR family oxidoreductase [Budvicia aquatica]|uniref:Bile acid 7-dehydroxylase 1/3 n=1 Tax=Budvicia aquatica TaxID=82979 RepID=A0A2C6DGF8_9GAMM|nr:SDR family oxidoreductase [Budvicia aquatica]PHI28297.1 short chain dehydrogenase [Budvicia aquatica]VFS46188.1 Bile acid 7-dehydroxylase 1/3 [Budvicia aquatica]
MNLHIEGRVAVVTGGSSGIGFETLRLLLAEGAKVAFCGRNADKLSGAETILRQDFPAEQMLAYRCDVLDPLQVADFAHAVEQRFGATDMLINNAGQGFVSRFDETPPDAWLNETKLKLFGVINPLEAFLPMLERSDIASVTCVNSLLALQPEEHMIATSAARAALLNMTLTLSKELIHKGIRVNSILLGMVESGQWRRRFAERSDTSQSWEQWTGAIAVRRGIPMKRLGKPQEPAQALLFLASPLASFTTGAALDVSGGFNRHL